MVRGARTSLHLSPIQRTLLKQQFSRHMYNHEATLRIKYIFQQEVGTYDTRLLYKMQILLPPVDARTRTMLSIRWKILYNNSVHGDS